MGLVAMTSFFFYGKIYKKGKFNIIYILMKIKV